VEYLVTMTTNVPDGTPDGAVDDIRTREAARARELASEGHLLRLWRPPLQPGEWRTLGLFRADDERQLEKALASMPLRVWRSDEVIPLSSHPNDPPPARSGRNRADLEFLTTLTLTVPDGTPVSTVDDTKAQEEARSRELGEAGKLLRLWAVPAPAGGSRALGLWRVEDAAEMQAILKSLPLYPWMTVNTTPLTPHPNDPASAKD
jgi:muconolactone delta-isomerase